MKVQEHFEKVLCTVSCTIINRHGCPFGGADVFSCEKNAFLWGLNQLIPYIWGIICQRNKRTS